MLYSDCQTEDLFTLVNLHCCIQDYYLAYKLISLIPRPRPVFHRLQYCKWQKAGLQATESWAGPGNGAIASWCADGKVVLVEHHHYTSCLALYMKSCYSCAGIQNELLLVIDHYCFVSELPSLSLVAQEVTAVSEKWQDIGEELGVGQYSLRNIHTKHSDPGDCLREVLSEKLCHHLGWYYCSSQVSSNTGLSTGR